MFAVRSVQHIVLLLYIKDMCSLSGLYNIKCCSCGASILLTRQVKRLEIIPQRISKMSKVKCYRGPVVAVILKRGYAVLSLFFSLSLSLSLSHTQTHACTRARAQARTQPTTTTAQKKNTKHNSTPQLFRTHFEPKIYYHTIIT